MHIIELLVAMLAIPEVHCWRGEEGGDERKKDDVRYNPYVTIIACIPQRSFQSSMAAKLAQPLFRSLGACNQDPLFGPDIPESSPGNGCHKFSSLMDHWDSCPGQSS